MTKSFSITEKALPWSKTFSSGVTNTRVSSSDHTVLSLDLYLHIFRFELLWMVSAIKQITWNSKWFSPVRLNRQILGLTGNHSWWNSYSHKSRKRLISMSIDHNQTEVLQFSPTLDKKRTNRDKWIQGNKVHTFKRNILVLLREMIRWWEFQRERERDVRLVTVPRRSYESFESLVKSSIQISR